jgi:hypothetical protein
LFFIRRLIEAGRTPDFEALTDADHNNRSVEDGESPERWRHKHPALRVNLDRIGVGEKGTTHYSRLAAYSWFSKVEVGLLREAFGREATNAAVRRTLSQDDASR